MGSSMLPSPLRRPPSLACETVPPPSATAAGDLRDPPPLRLRPGDSAGGSCADTPAAAAAAICSSWYFAQWLAGQEWALSMP